MSEDEQKISLIVPFSLYRKIKKEADKRTDKEKKFVAMNSIILEILEPAFK